ncbi:hypothetical protein [Yinghuangia soli]|uniref:Uncharacterized protein n=1 Tax=Yinghuangia soli TaxID=2908204 RepID=A0AA41U5I2_9ACTN|nr:hypothetical protein [Yinghuangia soli]MCF2533985.1 hypothetical protein [Yinghuangia soli]
MALLFAVAACTGSGGEDPVRPAAASSAGAPAQSGLIGPEGGTTNGPEGITVTVPKDSVDQPVQVVVGNPSTDGDQAPGGAFHSAAVRFDVSLGNGRQPQRPLRIRVPLRGATLPPGANPQLALLYGADEAGKFALLPSLIEGDSLVAELHHLSPKWVVYPKPKGFIDSLMHPTGPEDINKPRPVNCSTQLTVGGQTYRTKESPQGSAYACLREEGGKPVLRIVNNTLIHWSVAATTPVQPRYEEWGVDSKMLKLIAGILFPHPDTQGYVMYAEDIALPVEGSATVVLSNQPNTFFAEVLWLGLASVVGYLSGAGNKTASLVETVLESLEVLDCIRAAVHLRDDVSLTDAVSETITILSGECGRALAKALGLVLLENLDLNPLKGVFNRLVTLTEGIQDGSKLALSGFQNAYQSARGQKITITVEKLRKLPERCRSAFNERGQELTVTVISGTVTCTAATTAVQTFLDILSRKRIPPDLVQMPQGSSANTIFGAWHCEGGTIPEDFPDRTGVCMRNNGAKGWDEVATDYTGPLGTSTVAS